MEASGLFQGHMGQTCSVIKSKGLFLTEVDLADGRGKRCGCKQPQALSISTVPADVKTDFPHTKCGRNTCVVGLPSAPALW